jgi:hypothetical protein
MGKLMPGTVKGLLLLLAAVVAGCGRWSAPQAAPGPVPLGPPGKPIERLKREKSTFETTLTEILWNDGRGPVKAADRVKTIMDAVPKQLLDRLKMTRKALNLQGEPFDDLVYDARAVVVSLNPDVVIVSLGERYPPGRHPHDGILPGQRATGKIDINNKLFSDWDQRGERWGFVKTVLDYFGFWLGDFNLYAGPLVPWADEMYAFSTDPAVGFRRVNFENGQATVPLPKGKLVLHRRDINVDVSRE